MKEVLKTIFYHIFSFGTVCFFVITGLIFLLYTTSVAEYERREQNRLRTEACYERAMVLVNTDAGQRCVDPRSLVKVK